MSHADFGGFLESWSGELTAQALRVRQLIGDVHWVSDGNHKEAIIRSFLRRYLPTSLRVATGFALNPAHPEKVTTQQDILVCDFRDQAPFLVEDGFAVVPSTSVAAYLEVKSSLSLPTLRAALDSVFYSGSILSGQKFPPWRGVVFYANAEVDVNQLSRWMQAIASEIPLKQANPSDGPICIVGVNFFVAFLEILGDGKGRLRVLPTGAKSLAYGVIDLLSSVRPRLNAATGDQFESLANASFEGRPSIVEVSFGETS